jgi:hypothetical protein
MEFAIEFIRFNLSDEFIPEGMPDVGKAMKTYDNNCIVFIKEPGTYPDQ